MQKRLTWPNGTCAALTITFDDGYTDTYHETSAWLADHGLGATYYLISRQVGTSFEDLPTATWENWRLAAQSGHEIASHSATHAAMAGLSSDVRRIMWGLLTAPDRRALIKQTVLRTRALIDYKPEAADIQDPINPLLGPMVSRQEIIRHLPECPVVSYSYPAGRMSRSARQAVADAGYHSARGNAAGINDHNGSLFALRSICLGPGLTLQDMEPWFLRAIEQSGWLILTFHLVSRNRASHYPYHCSVEDFRRIVERIMKLPFWVTTQQAVVDYLKTGTPI
jgi:peptidoglycan/xylan/chitin deacetylase (PgdA/CDA1 family)